jgi:hypothetical protein
MMADGGGGVPCRTVKFERQRDEVGLLCFEVHNWVSDCHCLQVMRALLFVMEEERVEEEGGEESSGGGWVEGSTEGRRRWVYEDEGKGFRFLFS